MTISSWSRSTAVPSVEPGSLTAHPTGWERGGQRCPSTWRSRRSPAGGSCELTLEDGVLTALTAVRRPEELDAPTPQEDADALLVDHEYRLTLLELGLTAE